MMGAKRLVGMRFHPTDDELVNHHLRRKILKVAEETCVIPVTDIYSHEPSELNRVYDETSDEKSNGNCCYFFCPRGDTKTGYTKRKTRDGFWKETSEKQRVLDEETDEVMWTKRYFVYHQGLQSCCLKTDWVMHEYRLGSIAEDDTSEEAACALCHIKKKKKKNKHVKQRKTTPARSHSNGGAPQGSCCLDKEESTATQVTFESESSTNLMNSVPQNRNVDKPSEEQESDNNNSSMAYNYDADYVNCFSLADLINEQELDEQSIRAALY